MQHLWNGKTVTCLHRSIQRDTVRIMSNAGVLLSLHLACKFCEFPLLIEWKISIGNLDICSTWVFKKSCGIWICWCCFDNSTVQSPLGKVTRILTTPRCFCKGESTGSQRREIWFKICPHKITWDHRKRGKVRYQWLYSRGDCTCNEFVHLFAIMHHTTSKTNPKNFNLWNPRKNSHRIKMGIHLAINFNYNENIHEKQQKRFKIQAGNSYHSDLLSKSFRFVKFSNSDKM